uniref:ABC transporter domain-containing protein n=1 Tax=Terrapene triunguis TaxID=2587831 RepID=A0A674I1W1_9SAUR
MNLESACRTGLEGAIGWSDIGRSPVLRNCVKSHPFFFRLLDVLAGWKDPKGLRSGQIFMDGKSANSQFHLCSAYIVQEDILMGTLTVRENLQFSASLRLPQSRNSEAEKQLKVNAVIQELGLQECADTKIGTEFLRGVSGGEKKRCSIGVELITAPSLIFLDEPTTGLDANTANSIMQLLHQLSRKGRTVIFSIHQPRYSIFRLIDHLTLMNKGEIMYAGPAEESTGYFNSIGYQCEAFNNPLDFFLDVIGGEIMQSQPSPELGECCKITLAEKERGGGEAAARTMSCKSTSPKKYIGILYVVSNRNVKNILRNPQTSIGQLLLGTFFSVLVGLIFYQVPATLPEAFQNRLGAFFFLVINQVFGNLSAVELFINERKLFIHESSRGYYRTSAYFLAKVFADLIPNRIIPLLMFSGISYFMMGLKQDAGSFFLYVLSLSLTNLAAVSMAFLVSASVSTFAIANVLIALPFVFMMVFGGFLVNLNSMLSWLSWIKWISIFHYGMNVSHSPYGEDLAKCKTAGSKVNVKPVSVCCRVPGEEYLQQQGINYSTWGLWENEFALLCLSLAFLFFAYIQLLRVTRWK